jgi:hypothetical protein
MTTAIRIKREGQIVHIERSFDEACRRALMDGVPPSLRLQMVTALSAQPLPNAFRAQKEARKHFGKEADAIFRDAAALAAELHRFVQRRFALDGLLDWLDATGYGNDYRMIKVFAEWARLSDAAAKQIIQ